MKKVLAVLLVLLFAVSCLPAVAEEMPYYITVDLSSQIVTIYRTSDNGIVRQMLCSTGLNDATPTGTYTMPKTKRQGERSEWYYFPMFGSYAKYASRIVDYILFHSIPYSSMNESTISLSGIKAFGSPASHGCIRLLVEDSKFIAENCLAGTKVRIYKSGNRYDDLRELLFVSSYTGENGMTYDQFLGIPEDPDTLGRFSTGSEVEDLQHRLRALGFYDDEITGEYLSATVNAVRQVQSAMGLETTGLATVEFREMLYSSDAPTAQNVPLDEGASGPVVRKLQSELAALKLYDDEIDGVYDVDVIQAVQTFQGAYGYSVESIAQPEVQKAIRHEAEAVANAFAEHGDYTLTIESEDVSMVTVSAQKGIRVRSKPSTDSASLGRVTDGMRLIFLESSGGWSQVEYDGSIGYIKNDYLVPSHLAATRLSYASDDGTTYSFGWTAADYRNGAKLPCDVLEEESAQSTAQETQYATVNTRQDNVNLNLRKDPNSQSDVLASLPNGTRLRVLLRSGDWSLVTDETQTGYLLNEFLDFDGETADATASPTTGGDADYQDHIYAVVSCSGENAPVYDSDSEDANRIGKLPDGTHLNVIHTDDEWSLIELYGHQGYMKNEVLQFSMYEFEN